jgi:hypothetical protein
MSPATQSLFILTNILMIAGGITLIAFGLLQIFSKDLAWHITEWVNNKQGKNSKRSPIWDQSTTTIGVICIATGVMFLLIK